MAISYLVNYDANGNQDVTLEFDSYNESSISGLRYTDSYHGLQWLTFGSVAITALSTDDINAGYGGYVKIVAQNRSNDNSNMVFFIEQASTAFSGPGDSSMNLSILLLSNDWMNLWWQSGLISGTYMPNLQYGNTNWYRLDSDASDGVGSVNGTATNVTFQSGEGRDYAYFDGSGSKIDLGQSSNMGIGGTDDFTVSAWIRPDTLNMTSGQIFGTVVTGATSPQYAGFQFYIANGVLKFMIGGNGYDTISYTLPAGLEYIWSHFAVSRSGTEVKMYMNGALVHTGTTSAVHNITTSYAGHLYTIGSYYSPYNNTWYTGFEGGIDEVDVWNRRLSDSEISDYYANTNIVPPATVAIDQDVTAASIGDVLTATVDLQGGNLEYFAWELDGTIVAGGEGSPVVSLTVTEAMSEEPIAAGIRVDGNWFFSLEPSFPVLQSLVGHWSFDNGDANADIGDNGANSGSTFETLNSRTVVTFDGVDDYIQIPDPSVLSGDTWTISHWINTSATSGRQDYFSKWYSSNGNYPSIALGIDGGALKAYYRGDNKNSIGIMTGPSIADGSWHHVAYVKDSGEVRIYVDGSEVDQAAFSGTIPSTADVVLGAWDGSLLGYTKDHYFAGSLDGLRIYSRAFTTADVENLFSDTTVEDNAAPAPSGGTVDLTVFSSDSWGDGWNNGSVLITDANGDTVQNFTGPAAGVKYPDGLTETMTVTGGATYTYSVTPGSFPGEIAMTISDSDGNVLVTLAGTSGTGTFDAPAAPAESSSYDWTHEGQLTNIVKFSRGVDALGNPSYAYAKKEDDGTSTIFLTTDISDFAQFSSNATGATGIIGSPVCMEYGSGKLFMGTSTGNAYEIGFDGNTITSVLELHAMAGGESVREAKYDSIQNQWIFEAGEKIFTVVPGTTTAVERYVLPAGAKCMDLAPGDSGVAIIIKKADHSLSPIIATAGWTEISDETAMVASLNALGVADFNYDYVMDKWVAASASGQVLLADDLLQFLGGSGSPPPLGG